MAKQKKEYDREAGIQAIIGLQKMAGVAEPRERAERNWDAFSDHDKENTLAAADLFIPKEEAKLPSGAQLLAAD